MRLFVVALGLAMAAPAGADEQTGWVLYTKYQNGKVETISGLTNEVCQMIRYRWRIRRTAQPHKLLREVSLTS